MPETRTQIASFIQTPIKAAFTVNDNGSSFCGFGNGTVCSQTLTDKPGVATQGNREDSQWADCLAGQQAAL